MGLGVMPANTLLEVQLQSLALAGVQVFAAAGLHEPSLEFHHVHPLACFTEHWFELPLLQLFAALEWQAFAMSSPPHSLLPLPVQLLLASPWPHWFDW